MVFSNPHSIAKFGADTLGSTPGDALISEETFGGPLSPGDVRLIFDSKTLEHLLEICSQSLSGRVVLNGAGFKVKTWRGGDGNVYQTLSIVSLSPKAESTPFDNIVS